MNIYNIFEESKTSQQGILSIGFFDSLHIGHKKLLAALLAQAKTRNMRPIVLTFDTIPLKTFQNKTLLSLKSKLNLIHSLGIDHVILCNYEEIKHFTAEEFLLLLEKNFNVTDFVIGPDIRLGKNNSGNIETFQKLNRHITIVDPVMNGSEKVSTKVIRTLLLNGDMEAVTSLLGHPYFIEGTVIKGKQIGRTIGYPTMNIITDHIIYPQNGTYITKTLIGHTDYLSMTYVNNEIIETHLFGYNEFHYNFQIKIDFFKKLRDNTPLNNLNDLKIQLVKDQDATLNYFNHKDF